MKKILITGKGSYIGSHFNDYLLNNFKGQYFVDELDMLDSSWKAYDFSSYDVIYHVAGLAHSTPDESQRNLYYQVNTDLAYETSKKTKDAGVKQFIFMSSIIVYGSGKVGEDRVITKDGNGRARTNAYIESLLLQTSFKITNVLCTEKTCS